MKQTYLDFCQNALKFKTGNEAEILLIHSRNNLTRFAQNYIHQNMGEENTIVQWRIIKDSREGSYTTNRLDDEGMKRASAAACEIAKAQPRTASLSGLARGNKTVIYENASKATEKCSPSKRASLVKKIIQNTKKYNAVASGALCTQSSIIAIVNTSGIRSYQHISKAFLNFVPYRGNLSGYTYWMGGNIDDLPLMDLVEEAIGKINHLAKPVNLEPGVYPVVLSPYAVQNMIYHLSNIGFGAKAYLEKRSFMTKWMGKKIASKKVTIFDDGNDPAGIPMRFDYEGIPKKKVYFIKNGLASSVVHDSKTAALAGVESTGHALPHPNHFGPFAMNLIMKQGDVPEKKLIDPIKRGLYITKFHYMNVVEPIAAIMTGMTKDGTFLIENGKIKTPVRNLRFTQNILEALNNVEEVSVERRCKGDYGTITAPALRIKEFHFTGVSNL